MRCPKCLARVTHDKTFDVYDCPNGCGNRKTAITTRYGFEREEVLTEKEYQKYNLTFLK